MAIPPTSRDTILQAIEQFRRGIRSDRWPRPGPEWMEDARHKYVIVHDGAPYPIREIVRLAVRIGTGERVVGPWDAADSARKYVRRYGFAVAPRANWRRATR